jgi:hypothetical protein
MTTIIIKNSSTSSAVPVSGDLTKGELAVNVTDKKLYTKDNGGSVVKLVGGLGNQEASAVAITGGAIDGTPIGGTTASTASFTTLSASGNVTLSGGTANGVLYLNGSKVATSGSALTWNTNLFSATGSNGGYSLQLDTTTTPVVIKSNDNTGSSFLPIAFSLGNGGSYLEQMRLTSTGLGIGTSSPSEKLTVNGNIKLGTSGTSWIYGPATTGRSIYSNSDSTAYIIAYGSAYGGSNDAGLQFTAGTSNTMVFNSSGNLGLGVTPSAWFSVYRALQIGSFGSAIAGQTNSQTLSLWNNAFPNASNVDTYTTTNAATKLLMNGGQFQFFTAASGTAGDAITFTQAMTLTAGGNLALGTTSPTEISNYVSQTLNGSSGSFTEYRQNGANTLRVGSDSGGGFIFTQSTTAIKFGTNDVERARIDSSGNFLLGLTSQTNTPANGVVFQNLGTTSSQMLIGHANSSGNGTYYEAFFYDSSVIGSITQSGTTAVLFNVTSDQRLKENIADADSASSLIDSLQVRKFDWKADGNHQRYGFVAQELVTVAPEAVHQPADPEQMMAVDYSKLVPMLVKEIQSLRARVAALES